jgi:hypothetical protein
VLVISIVDDVDLLGVFQRLSHVAMNLPLDSDRRGPSPLR